MPEDFFCEWGGDFVLNATGTLQSANGWDRIRQRIVRRILTNAFKQLPDGSYTAPDYVYDTAYGVGLGALVDENPSRAYVQQLTAMIKQGIALDAAVDTSYPPVVVVQQIANYITISATIKTTAGSEPQTIDIDVPATGLNS